MKIYIIALLLIVSSVLVAQKRSDQKALIQEKMSIFHSWTGQWEGSGHMDMEGTREKFTQSEDIRLTMDGMLLTIEGIGYSEREPDLKIHHAFATISYHPDKEAYVMKSYTFEGQYTDAVFEHLEGDSYKWYFDVPGGSILFYIDMSDNQWEEKGYFRDPRGNEYPFLQMNLVKQ